MKWTNQLKCKIIYSPCGYLLIPPPQWTYRTFGHWSFNCQVLWCAALFVLKSGRMITTMFGLVYFNSNKTLNTVYLHVACSKGFKCGSLKRRNLNSSLLYVTVVHPSAHCFQHLNVLLDWVNSKRRSATAGHAFTINLPVNTLGIKITKCCFCLTGEEFSSIKVIIEWRHSLRLHHFFLNLKRGKSLKFLAWRLRGKKNSLEIFCPYLQQMQFF